MKYMLLLLALPACSTGQAFAGLEASGKINAQLRRIAIDHYTARCGSIAKQCRTAGDKACPSLRTCHRDADTVVATSAALDASIVEAMQWLVADDDRAWPIIVHVAESIATMRKYVKAIIDAAGGEL